MQDHRPSESFVQVQPRIVDLFCGCGGFSLGAHVAGLPVSVAVDIDPILTSSFRKNFPKTKLLNEDISTLTGKALVEKAGGAVDLVFGGPPCQAFSTIGRRSADDPRRSLLGHFFRIVDELQPKFFVMENVPGLTAAYAGGLLSAGLDLLRDRYAVLKPTILNAADFGAATNRKRLFVLGARKDDCDPIRAADIDRFRRAPATVRDAIDDLEAAEQLEDVDGFDRWRIVKRGRPTSYAAGMRAPDGTFTGHRVTKHTAKVSRRFGKVLQGEVDEVGRHPKLAWDGQCPTLRAGTGSDRGSYQSVRPLHPEEPRVITAREAARLQGFPDTFVFHPTTWHSFRMIGNSVSPIMSTAIFSLIRSRLMPDALAVAAE
jgi:DNA (cytosine-5)-methyltransferase 1